MDDEERRMTGDGGRRTEDGGRRTGEGGRVRREMVAWRCRRGAHVMGQVQRNGRGIPQLYLYRQAVDLDAAELAEVEVMAIVEGLVMDVRCSVCGAIRTWVPSARSETRRAKRNG